MAKIQLLPYTGTVTQVIVYVNQKDDLKALREALKELQIEVLRREHNVR